MRIATYDVLQNWIKCSNYNSAFESIAEQLIGSILHDIKTPKFEVTLKAVQGARKHLSKKARRNLQRAQNEQSNISKEYGTGKIEISETVDQKDAALCAKALECLGTIILICGTFLKPNIHKLLHETIVITAYNVVNSNLDNNNTYTFWKCRIELLRCLTNLILSCHSLVPAPLQYALQILTISQKIDRNQEVQNVCRILLSSLEKIIHPQKESLVFQRDEDDHIDENSSSEASDIDVANTEESIGPIQLTLEKVDNTLDKIIDKLDEKRIVDDPELTHLRMSISPLNPVDTTSDQVDTTILIDNNANAPKKIIILSNELVDPPNEKSAVAVVSSSVDVVQTNGNHLDSTIELEDNEPLQANHLQKRRANHLETIDLDSDENDNDDVMEIVDTVEPQCKKTRISEVTKDNVIDCDDVEDVLESFEADFNDELNVHVIAD